MKMASFYNAVVLLSIACIVGLCSAQNCQSIELARSYTGTDGIVAARSAFVLEFSATCTTTPATLTADIDGHLSIASYSKESKTYQFSWSDDITKTKKASRSVKIYDDDGATALRNAQRAGQPTDSIPVLFSTTFSTPGAYKGPAVASEAIAILTVAVLWWFAHSTKSKL